MNIIFLLTLVLCIIVILWRWYRPSIEIIVDNNHYKVYLWYNKHIEIDSIKRVYKCLFKI